MATKSGRIASGGKTITDTYNPTSAITPSKKAKALPVLPNLPTPGAATPGSGVPVYGNVPSGLIAGVAMPSSVAAASPAASGLGSPQTARSANPTAASSTTPQATGVSSQTGYAPEMGFTKQAGYAPDFLDTIINQHPEILTGDVLKSLGMGGQTSYAGQLADESGVAQLVSFLLQSQAGTSGNNNDTINAMANFYKNRVTPGGSLIDTQGLINDILHADPSSKIYQELGLGSASGAGSSSNPQVNANADAVNQMIGGLLTSDQNRYTQQASRNYLSQQESNYINDMAKGKTQASDYLQYLRNHSNLGSWF